MKNLVLSSSGGSGWSVSMFNECSEKFRLRYIENIRSRIVPQPLWFGDIIHQALLIEGLERRRPRDDVVARLNGLLTARFAEPVTDGVTFEIKDSQETLLTLATKMADIFGTEPIQPLKVEHLVEIPLTDPDTGNVVGGVTVRGRIDLIEAATIQERYDDNRLAVEKASGDQHVIIADLKTSASKLTTIAGHLFQLSVYAYLAYIEAGKLPDYVGIYNVTKTKEPSLQKIFHKPTMADVRTIFATISGVAESIGRDRYPKNYANCVNRYHQPCPYQPICMPNAFEVPEIELVKTTFINEGVQP